MAMLGEQFTSETLVGGLVLNLKPQFDKIAVWITNSKDTEGVAQTKKEIIDILQVDEKEIEYSVFKELATQEAQQRDQPQREGKQEGAPTRKFTRGGNRGRDNNNFFRNEGRGK